MGFNIEAIRGRSLAVAPRAFTFRLESLGGTALLLLVGFLTLFPLVMVIYASFNSGNPSLPGRFTLDGYREVLNTPRTLTVAWNTLWVAAARTFVTMAIAIFFAWVVARTDTPLRGLIRLLVIFKFFLPYQPFIIAWILLLAPKSGIINVFLANTLNLGGPLFDVFSHLGIIWVAGLAWVPLAFLIVLPAFENMDASLEESSRMSGAGKFTTFARVTMPVVAPAILGATMLGFIHALESFDAEVFLGTPAKIYFFSTSIYSDVAETMPPQFSKATAFSVMLLLAVSLLIVAQYRWITSKQHKYTTLTGRGYTVRPIKLGRWKYVTLSLALLFFFLSTVLPGTMVLLGTFMKASGIFVPGWFTLEHWQNVLGNSLTWGYYWNTLFLAAGSATVGVVFFSLISYTIVRTRYFGRPVLEFLTWLPYIMPGIVLALGLLWVYVGTVRLPFALYGTIWLLMICMVTKRITIGVRTLHGVTVQVSKELEEASRVHGAAWWRTFWKVFLPLVWPGLVSAWLMIAVFSVKELIVVLMLYGANSKTLSVRLFELSTQQGSNSAALVIGVLEMTLALLFWAAAWLATRRSRLSLS